MTLEYVVYYMKDTTRNVLQYLLDKLTNHTINVLVYPELDIVDNTINIVVEIPSSQLSDVEHKFILMDKFITFVSSTISCDAVLDVWRSAIDNENLIIGIATV